MDMATVELTYVSFGDKWGNMKSQADGDAADAHMSNISSTIMNIRVQLLERF